MKKSLDNGTGNRGGNVVLCEGPQGIELRGSPLRFDSRLVAFELYHPEIVLQVSEVMGRFRILINGTLIYSGKAVLSSVVQTEGTLICEATLDECWLGDQPFASVSKESIGRHFQEFLAQRQRTYRIRHEYKVVIADLQTLLADTRLWLGQVELGLRSFPAADGSQLEDEIARGLLNSGLPAMNELFDRFEAVSDEMEEDLRPVHQAFAQRQLHPFLLCSPFLYRTYAKPLGYAGDYEMINMIIRNRLQGSSLFAKLIDGFLLDQAPPRAVRSRVDFLTERIVAETARVSRLGRPARIYSLGCGPAREVENFLANHPLANRAQFCLLDFNDETIEYVSNRMAQIRNPVSTGSEVKLVRNSVQSLLKSGSRRSADEPVYDLIYCSGLYDYLSDRVCQSLNDYLYDRLSPGGKLVIGNFAPWTPRQNLMEDLAEWFLIYRDSKQVAALAPVRAPKEDCVVWAEETGSNIFLEVRKPQ